MKKRHPFTLIETLIGFSLAALMLSSLLFSYSYMQKLVNAQVEEMENSLSEMFFHKRLEGIFQEIEHFDENGKLSRCGLYRSESAGGSLVFTMDNKIDPETHLFSNQVIARLYVNRQKQLCLRIWAHPHNYPLQNHESESKKEVLAEGVESISFRFYKPRKINSNLVIDPEQSLWGWQETWDIDDQMLPAMIEVSLTYLEKKRESLFYFPIPNSSHPIVFPQT